VVVLAPMLVTPGMRASKRPFGNTVSPGSSIHGAKSEACHLRTRTVAGSLGLPELPFYTDRMRVLTLRHTLGRDPAVLLHLRTAQGRVEV
jgi:hypothetical protein